MGALPSTRFGPESYAPYQRTQDNFVLISRQTLTMNSGDIAIPAATVTKAQANFGFGKLGTTFAAPAAVNVNPGDAIRIVKGSWCQCASDEAANVLTLRCQTLVLRLGKGAGIGTPVRVYPGNYTGNVLGQTGQFLEVSDDELLFGFDYAEQSATSPFKFVCLADVQSTEVAAPRNIILLGMVQFETWRTTTTSRMRG